MLSVKTLPGEGFFVILRIDGPTKTFFDKSSLALPVSKRP
jgi:hypothetical protein